MPMLLFLLFFAEVAAMIKLAQVIGGGFVLLEIVATAALGYALLRAAGRTFPRTAEWIGMMANPRQTIQRSGWGLMIAGLLLIVPGLLSDLLALALVLRFLWSRASKPRPASPDAPAPKQDVHTIDVEYRVHDDTSE